MPTMVNLNKIIYTIIFPALFTTAFPMGYTKKAVSAAGTVAHYTAAGWMFKKGVERLLEDEEKTLKEYSLPAPEPIANFVQGILRRQNIPNPETVKVHIHKGPQSPYASGKRVVLIDIDEAQTLAYCLENSLHRPFKIKTDRTMGCSIRASWTPAEYLVRTVAIITHEAKHMLAHDKEKKTAAYFAIPLLTFMLSRYKPILTLVQKSLTSKVASGLILNEINQITFGAYSRRIEYQADDAITEVPEMVMLIKDLHIISHTYPPNPNIYGLLKNSHPDPRYRITRLIDRVEIAADQE